MALDSDLKFKTRLWNFESTVDIINALLHLQVKDDDIVQFKSKENAKKKKNSAFSLCDHFD